MKKISGKWALVTGASRGIGAEISLSLAKLGCNVILHSSRASLNMQLQVEKIKKKGVLVKTIYADFSDPLQVKNMLDQLISNYPKLEIIYNNAANMHSWHDDIWQIPISDIEISFQINLFAMINICFKFIPIMIKNGWGRIINLTSDIVDIPQLLGYSLSKAAVDKFTKDYAKILNKTSVTMNLINPGWTKTDLGGENAPNLINSVIPGALLPLFLDNGINGRLFNALDYKGLSLEQAILVAQHTFNNN